jgi:peptide/nickel transport system ATP-binding protein
MADEVIVMRHGEVVERGAADQIFGDPRHDYTRRLLDAVPSVHSRGKRLAPSSAPRLSLPAQAILPERVSGSARPLLQAKGLVKRFRGPDKTLRTAVRGVSFALAPGETLGVVGESGSGKSTIARMVMALETPDEGEVLLNGAPWTALTEKQRQPLRHDISIVYQDALSSFDPRWTVERIIEDSIGQDEAHRREQLGELLDLVSLSTTYRSRRPLELSGGQRQRVAIARVIASRPKIIICDEPVSALDVSIQAQILDLLGDLKQQFGMSYLFISHDLGVIHHLSDRVLVMNQGEAVETGEADDILLRPQSFYTQSLVTAVPRLRLTPAA